MRRPIRPLLLACPVGLIHLALEHIQFLLSLRCQFLEVLQNRGFLSSHFLGDGV
jgi:hypothetical protein